MDINSGPSGESKNENHGKGKRKFKAGQGKYRPYAGSQKEGQGFADLRKKKAAKEYLKFLEKERKTAPSEKDGNSVRPPLQLYDVLSRSGRPAPKFNAFSKAQRIADEKKKQKQEEREHNEKEQESRTTAMKAYKAKKKEQFLKLCKKTRKGQPVMKNQMEVLLQKVMKHKGLHDDGHT